MELILANSRLEEIMILRNAEYEASVGGDNLFTLKVPKTLYADIKDGFILCDGDNEAAGGRVTTVLVDSDDDIITFEGVTWLGVFKELTTVANRSFSNSSSSEVVNALLSDAQLSDFFEMLPTSDNITSLSVRYGTTFSDLIESLLKDKGLILDFKYNAATKKIDLMALPIKTITDDTVTSDHFRLKLQKTVRPYTEAIALSDDGFSATAYLQEDGTVGNKPFYKGIDRRVYIYSNNSNNAYAETVSKLKEVLLCDSAEINVTDEIFANVGDTVGAVEEVTGVYVEAKVSEKIVKEAQGVTLVNYITQESEGK